MTTARQFLNLIHAFERFKQASVDPEALLASVSDDELKLIVQAAGSLFLQVKKEAERRGLWESFKTVKVGKK